MASEPTPVMVSKDSKPYTANGASFFFARNVRSAWNPPKFAPIVSKKPWLPSVSVAANATDAFIEIVLKNIEAWRRGRIRVPARSFRFVWTVGCPSR